MIEPFISYQPKFVTPPVETLADLLEEHGMTQNELGLQTGWPAKTIKEIVSGKVVITPEIALQLEKLFATPADYWLNHEAHYRAYLALSEKRLRQVAPVLSTQQSTI